ncbi:MAG: ribonuclease D [Dongiaceae bacterium]
MNFTLHHHDLPATFKPGKIVAVDCEMMGLDPRRDRLCLVQIKGEKGNAHLVKFDGKKYNAPRLKKILEDKNIQKIFHFGAKDLMFLSIYLDAWVVNYYDTKIASRLARSFSNEHGLDDLASALLGVKISKQQQSTDWGAETLTDAQLEYAAGDVLHLHAIKKKLDVMLKREKRLELAELAFQNILNNAALELGGFDTGRLFLHH